MCFSPEIGIGYFIPSVSCYEYRFVFADLEIILQLINDDTLENPVALRRPAWLYIFLSLDRKFIGRLVANRRN